MAEATHWLEYGDPIAGTEKVEATHRVTYMTGPNEQRDDDVVEGTLTYDGLSKGWGENHENEHVHDDGSLCLSAMDDDERTAVMAEFEPADAHERLRRLVAMGMSPAAALDYHMVEDEGWSQSDWAKHRDVGQQAISKNIAAAREQLDTTDN